MTKFICLSGKAESGKDTTANIMKEILELNNYKVRIMHYADLVKFICKSYFDWDGQKDEKGRTLLQYVGTDCVRKVKPDYWVDFIIDLIKLFPNEWDYVILADTRFPNEINKVREEGFKAFHIQIQRENHNSILTQAQLNHKSETALDNVTPDYIISNNSTVEQLKTKIAECVCWLMYC